MYKPLAETLPTCGFTVQVTAVLVDPLTEAENCLLCEAARLTLPGDTVTVTAAVKETTALAVFDGSAELVAVTVTL